MSCLLRSTILCLILWSFESFAADESDLKQDKISRKVSYAPLNKYKKYIENTIWVVPPTTLLAIYYEDGNNIPKSDQTVWVIGKCEGQYFFGDSYTSLDQVPSSHMRIVGSVTPLGDVYMTFYSTTGNLLNTDVINGIGKFTKKDGEYVFVMQMNSASNSLEGLSHWSYMVSVEKGDLFYKDLPGQNMSVPQFLSQF